MKSSTKKTFFTPGPAALYPTVEKHIQTALDEQITSISHRSSQYRDIYRNAYLNLKTLLNIPDHFAVLFTGSATEIWEKFLMSCTQQGSFHLVNGAFSERFYEFAALLKRNAIKYGVPFGQGFEVGDVLETLQVCDTAEVIAFTQNETSSGVSVPDEDIRAIAMGFPEKLSIVDMVSSAPYPQLDFQHIDSAFFSVQKAFGLPAGLGVWIVNERCLKKAKELEKKDHLTGAYNTLTSLWKSFEKFENPATPNVLGIYLLSKVTEDFLNRGIDTLREETNQKAAILYSAIEKSPVLDVFVKKTAWQSKSVIVADTKIEAGILLKKLEENHIEVGAGYQDYKDKQIRIANFPANDMEATERLADLLQNF